jgi:hypothetical protein
MGIPLLAAPLDAGVLHPFHGQLLLCDHPRTKVQRVTWITPGITEF